MKRSTAILVMLLVILIGCNVSYAAEGTYKISGWGATTWQTPSGVEMDNENNGIMITVDPNVVASGRGSLHIFFKQQMDYQNAKAGQTVSALENGKTYIIKGKFKIPGNSWRYRLLLGGSELVQIAQMIDNTIGEWAEGEYIFMCNSATKEFAIQNTGGAGSLYADDLSLREVIFAEDGETITDYGEELLVNGGFEDDIDLTAPSEVSNISVTNYDSGAEVTWTNPEEEDFKRVYVYDTTDGEKTLLGYTTDGKHTLSGLTNGSTYSILICTVDINLNVSQGTVVEVTPIADAFKCEEPQFYIDDVKSVNIASGTLKAEMLFKNNRMSEDYSAELILVLLKDGALCDIKSSYRIIEKLNENDPYTPVSVEIFVPDGDGYSAVLYVWDSITGMEAIKDCYIIE